MFQDATIIRGNVYLVDDDESVRTSLAFLLTHAGFNCISFPSAEDFLAAPLLDGPACVILDLTMPGMSGIELFRELRARKFSKPILFLTAVGTIASAVEAIRLGALEYFEKPIEPFALIESVKKCLKFGEQAALAALTKNGLEQRVCTLTVREREIMSLISEGMPSKQIASRLGRSIKTIEVHRSHLSKKLGATSAANLLYLLAEYKHHMSGIS